MGRSKEREVMGGHSHNTDLGLGRESNKIMEGGHTSIVGGGGAGHLITREEEFLGACQTAKHNQ